MPLQAPKAATSTQKKIWNTKTIRALVKRRTGKRACWWQIKVAKAIWAGKDVVGVAATGAGKTLSFWIPILMAQEEGLDKTIIVVTPLNLLGKQNSSILNDGVTSAIAVTKENSHPGTYKDISSGKYSVVTISPELLNDEPCKILWNNAKFASRLMYMVFDEGHCISQWGRTFRNEYLHVGVIRYLLPNTIPFYVASATLPQSVLRDVSEILRLRPSQLEHIIRSNDRPNINLVVRPIEHTLESYEDLAFLVPEGWKEGDPPLKKFAVFMDSTTHTEAATKAIRKRLPPHLRDKIRWFHATMTNEYRDENLEAFRKGEIWGLFVTDAFGMGLDLPDIELVVQYRASCDFNTLWQRFGRAGRALSITATAIFLVESGFFDSAREKKLVNAAKRAVTRKKKGAGTLEGSDLIGGDILLSPRSLKRKSTSQGSSSPKRQRNSVNLEPTDTVRLQVSGYATTDDERRILYQSVTTVFAGAKRKSRTSDTVTIGSALDDLINAPTRDIPCRRRVCILYYNNDKIHDPHDHIFCDEANDGGCTRCQPRPAGLCCDLCSPGGFDGFKLMAVPKQPRATSRMTIPMFTQTDAHHKLRASLNHWRDVAALEKFGSLMIQQWGSQFLISDNILDRIVHCAGSFKLTNIDILRIETHWVPAHLAEFGSTILDIVAEHFPPLPSMSVSTARRSKCSACGQTGHNRINRKCPKHPSTITAAAPKENQDPSQASPVIHMDTPSRISSATGNPSHLPLLPYLPTTPLPLISQSSDHSQKIVLPSNPSTPLRFSHPDYHLLDIPLCSMPSTPLASSSLRSHTLSLPFFQTADSTFNPTSTPRYYCKP